MNTFLNLTIILAGLITGFLGTTHLLSGRVTLLAFLRITTVAWGTSTAAHMTTLHILDGLLPLLLTTFWAYLLHANTPRPATT